tara:strand:- start:219 stop:440 length:222 start_codon:yes stop_codon:yes gene_type:complete
MDELNLKEMTWEDLAKEIVNTGDLIRDQNALIEKQSKIIDQQDKLMEQKDKMIKELLGNNRLLMDIIKAKESE